MQKFKIPLIILSISLLSIPVVTSEADYVILSDAVSSSGCGAKSNSYLLGSTIGQTVIGMSSSATYIETAGFRHLGMPPGCPVLAVELSSFTAIGYEDYVEVEWTTATEIDNAGFNLYRGLKKDGEKSKLNAELISAQGNELEGASYSFTDTDVTSGVTYYYWLEDVDLHGRSAMHGPVSTVPTSVEDREEEAIPTFFSLAQNYPNPFNLVTRIKYALPKDCHVRLEIYNILGHRITTLIDGEQKAGYKIGRWDASSFTSGVYFHRLMAGDFVETKRMVLLK